MGNRLRMALSRRVRGVAMAVLAALAFSLSGPIPATFAQDQVIELNVGLRLVNSGKFRLSQCLESTAKMVFQVSDLDYNVVQLVGIPTVVVSASDGTEYEAIVSEPDGYTVIEYPLNTEGHISFEANVRNNVNPPIKFTLEVVPCYWTFIIHLDEEYDLAGDQSLVIAADAFVGGDLKRVPSYTDESSDYLKITDSIGHYGFSLKDTIEPLDLYLDPAISGQIMVELQNSFVGAGRMDLTFKSSATNLPEMVNIGFKDVSGQGNQIYVTAPVPTSATVQSDYSSQFFDPVEKMMLRTVILPETGGVMETSPDKVFIQSPDRISSTAIIIVKTSKEPQGPSTWIYP